MYNISMYWVSAERRNCYYSTKNLWLSCIKSIIVWVKDDKIGKVCIATTALRFVRAKCKFETFYLVSCGTARDYFLFGIRLLIFCFNRNTLYFSFCARHSIILKRNFLISSWVWGVYHRSADRQDNLGRTKFLSDTETEIRIPTGNITFVVYWCGFERACACVCVWKKTRRCPLTTECVCLGVF